MDEDDIEAMTTSHPYNGVYSPRGARPKIPDQPKTGILKPRTLVKLGIKILR